MSKTSQAAQRLEKVRGAREFLAANRVRGVNAYLRSETHAANETLNEALTAVINRHHESLLKEAEQLLASEEHRAALALVQAAVGEAAITVDPVRGVTP